MTAPAVTRDRFLAAYDRVTGDGRRRPAWLRRLRDEAATRFRESGLPGTRDEDWKYTSLSALEEGEFGMPPDGRPLPPEAAGPLRAAEEGHALVFLDGKFRREWSTRKALPAGAHLGSLAEALSGELDGLVPYFSRSPLNPFTDLNTMLMGDGAFIHLAPGVEIDEPVHILRMRLPRMQFDGNLRAVRQCPYRALKFNTFPRTTPFAL